MPPTYYRGLAEMTRTSHHYAYATNDIYDAFGPAQGLPFVSIVERQPQRAMPTSVHQHHGFSELIVLLHGRVVLWCGPSPSELMPYRLEPPAMFLIPDHAFHVFLNGPDVARWMIMFTPAPGGPEAESREEVSQRFTKRGIPLSPEAMQAMQQSLDALLRPGTP